MQKNMNEKKVLVTGASRGIGAKIAQSFAEEGAYVIGTRTSLKKDSDDHCAEWLTADFSFDEQTHYCASKVRQISPDIIINNAGCNKIATFTEILPEDFLRIQRVNVFAPFMLCQAAIPGMKRRNWGRIVNISSIWGKIGKEYRASYVASKFALDGITLAIAAEYSRNEILANCVAPGFTDTELTRSILTEGEKQNLTNLVPARRMADPQEIANFVTWLGSDKNTYITGQNIAIDGGFARV